uniref:ethanolamine-phosphate cytidylyltransferase n=1 Tax=Macrostomum lignano TaxID=282301 RepID=A0A1I8ILL8_9PLAT
MVHFGHANAIRQAKSLGDYLLVGVHSDEEIEHHKGPPVFTSAERYKMVRAIKWVDEVVEAAPYITTVETLEKHNCDFCAHGDSSLSAIPYRQGVQAHRGSVNHRLGWPHAAGHASLSPIYINCVSRILQAATSRSPYTATCQFVPTTQQLKEFSTGRAPEPGEKIAFVCGAFDLFHVGHIDFLEKCYSMATYVIIGIHSDQIVNWYRGYNYPIMTMFERVLSVLACRVSPL